MAALWKEHLTKVCHFFFPTLYKGRCSKPRAVRWERRVRPDSADAGISTAATRVSPGKVVPLFSCLFMSEWLSHSQCMGVWSHARININEKAQGECVKCVSYLIHRGNYRAHFAAEYEQFISNLHIWQLSKYSQNNSNKKQKTNSIQHGTRTWGDNTIK